VATSLTVMWQLRFWSLLPHINVAGHSIGDVAVVGGVHYGWQRRRGEGGDEVGVHVHCG